MTEPTYLSNSRPDFEPYAINCGRIAAYRYKGNLKQELAKRHITKAEAVSLLEDMLMIRELEEMIVKLRSGAYEPIRDFNYRGPTQYPWARKAPRPGLARDCGLPTRSPARIAVTAKASPKAPWRFAQ